MDVGVGGEDVEFADGHVAQRFLVVHYTPDSQKARLDSVRWPASRIEINMTLSVRVKSPLSQRSFDSLKAAKPTPSSRTRITRVPMWNRMRRMARSPGDKEQAVSSRVHFAVGFLLAVELKPFFAFPFVVGVDVEAIRLGLPLDGRVEVASLGM